jgi:hypothetical protein
MSQSDKKNKKQRTSTTITLEGRPVRVEITYTFSPFGSPVITGVSDGERDVQHLMSFINKLTVREAVDQSTRHIQEVA